jgi:hypothetical protein
MLCHTNVCTNTTLADPFRVSPFPHGIVTVKAAPEGCDGSSSSSTLGLTTAGSRRVSSTRTLDTCFPSCRHIRSIVLSDKRLRPTNNQSLTMW